MVDIILKMALPVISTILLLIQPSEAASSGRGHHVRCVRHCRTMYGAPITPPPGLPQQEYFTPPIYSDIKFHRFWLDVSWEDDKTDFRDLIAPVGYQACKYAFAVANRSSGRDGEAATVSVIPLSFYPGDRNSAPRFRGYRVTLHAKGNQRLFDKVGASVDLRDLIIFYVSDDLTLFQRWEDDCDTPNR